MSTSYRKPWVQRHWILTLLLTFGAMFVLMIAMSTMAAYSMMSSLKRSAPYIEALSKARANPRLQSLLGQPIEDSPWMFGVSQQQQGHGEAVFYIPVHGPKAQAAVHVEAEQHDGVWQYKILRAMLEKNGEVVDLR
ncbi:MAG: cytochrome c oxidase assembly factor Coa1 family protein [Lysobacter sp.]